MASLLVDPANPDIQTSNESVIGEGSHVFETNMPDGAVWTSGLTVKVELQSPYPGDSDEWETLHTFCKEGTQRIDLVAGRNYRVVASAVGPWVYLNTIKERITR